MSEANFAAIYNQSDFSIRQSLENVLRNRFIPFSNPDGRIVQKTAYAPRQTGQAGSARDLFSNFTQVDRATLIQSDQQPGQVTDSGFSFLWTNLVDLLAWFKLD